MIRHIPLIALGAVALAACQPETIGADNAVDPMANELAAAPPVELPPAITSTKTYRCADNSVVNLDWLADGSANLRVGDAAAPTRLIAGAEGGALTNADGTSLTGDAQAASVSLTLPGKSEQSCKA